MTAWCPALSGRTAEKCDQLRRLGLAIGEIIAGHGAHDAMVKVIFQDLALDPQQGGPHGLKLGQNIHAIAVVLDQSAYRADARSSAGAGGLTQLMPGTARELGVRDRFDPVENLRGGADYLARQILRFGDLRLALAAYNAGPGRVARLGRIPDIAETQSYVATVVDCYLALTAGQGVTNSRQCRSRGAAR